MHIKFSAVYVLIACLIYAPCSIAVPDIHSWQSETGAEIFFVRADEIPIVDIELIFDAGGARNSPQYAGLAALTNSLLDEGAAGLTADQISQGFDDLGAIYGAASGYDFASISLRSLVDTAVLGPALENLAKVLTKADFPDDALLRQKNKMLVGIQNKKQSPGAVAKDAFFAAVFGDHPYATPISGTLESINAIERDHVLEFYQRYYVAKNLTVAIVGDLTKTRAQLLVDILLKKLSGGDKPEPLPEVLDLREPVMVQIDHPSSQTHILLGQTGFKHGDEDYFPLYVGNHVLGGGGMVSRLFEEIREKRGLSYSAYSLFSPRREKGIFMASLQTRADQAQEALQLLNDNLREFINQGPSAEELERAKKNITGGFPLRLDSNSKILSYIGLIGFYDLPINYLDTFNSKINAVTVDQAKDAFQRHLSVERSVTIMVGGSKQEGPDGAAAGGPGEAH